MMSLPNATEEYTEQLNTTIFVKLEPADTVAETGVDTGESLLEQEAAAPDRKINEGSLFAGHEVKEELYIGPVVLQQSSPQFLAHHNTRQSAVNQPSMSVQLHRDTMDCCGKRSKRRRVRSTTKQLDVLTDYMAAHPQLANNQFYGPQGKAERERQWEALRVLLKEYGADKTTEQWEHSWRDLRRNARNAVARRNSAHRATSIVIDVPELANQQTPAPPAGAETATGITGVEETSIVFETASDPLEMVHTNGYKEPSPSTSSSEAVPKAEDSKPLSKATECWPLSKATESGLLSRTTESWPLSRATECGATDNGPLSDSKPVEGHATGRRPVKRRQGLGTRAADFLEAELETNSILSSISSQLADMNHQLALSNTYNAIRTRSSFRERIWRLRNQRFNF